MKSSGLADDGVGVDSAKDAPGPEVQFLGRLDDLRVPLWTGGEGFQNAECSRPPGWQKLTWEENEARLARFHRDFQPFICANTGILTVFDSDSKNGGDPEKVRALLTDELKVRIYAEVTTPSGGKHFWIKGHPDLPTVHSKEDKPKLPGYPGLDIQSHGANVFLPGTLRTKYGYTPYTVMFNELGQIADACDDEALPVVKWVAEQLAVGVQSKARKISGGAKEWEWDPCPPWDGTPPDKRQKSYLHAALAREAAKVARTAQGGRNDALFTAALKLGSYIAGAGLDEQKVIAALEDAAITNGYTAEDGVMSTAATALEGIRLRAKRLRPPVGPARLLFGNGN